MAVTGKDAALNNVVVDTITLPNGRELAKSAPSDATGAPFGAGNPMPVAITSEVEVKNDAGNPLAVTGPVTDAQLRAAPVQVSVVGGATAVGQAAQVASLQNIEAGLGADGATPPAIAGTGVRGWLRALYEALIARLPATLGQKTAAASLPVVLASDQSAVTVAGQAAVGSAPVNPPLSVSGVDPAGNKQHLAVDTSGRMRVAVQAAFTGAYVPIPAFAAGNTAGAGGANATVVQVVAANANRHFLEIVNNGTADVELWFGARPADAGVNQAIKQGVVLAAGGGGRFFDARVPTGAVFAAASAASGLSVLEG
ncbi:hypothetical protein [Salinarimonas soli]|uniref:Uncharacterized protein n=1 Tax=Salinarimonas soli TaxID=1638099 RepID=A0A5B2VFL7_9HYPH|nr:hypothetical protein [Salinarimonas soli]KAA2237655.1 hypothetical protein F0L46_08215 [Salinarimonas soli]